MEPSAPSASGAASAALPKFKSFVSEADIAEIKKKRQEEWEKVRKNEDPIEVPEEEYDPRCLYDRLKEQKDKKQTDYEEAHKLKNLIRGLDDDEVSFLELVDKTKLEIESKIINEEKHEINEFRKAVAHLSEESQQQQLTEIKKKLLSSENAASKKLSKQQDLLSKAVKRKSSTGGESSGGNSSEKLVKKTKTEDTESSIQSTAINEVNRTLIQTSVPSSLTCIGVLPGLGEYNSDSSDSENSSDSSSPPLSSYEAFDLVGRRIIHQVSQAKSSN